MDLWNLRNATEKEKEWFFIEDIIGPSREWPGWIRDLFLGKNLNHAQRPLLCAFAVYNGLNPEVCSYDLIQNKQYLLLYDVLKIL